LWNLTFITDAQVGFHFDEGFGSETLDYRQGMNASISNVQATTWLVGAIGSGSLSFAGSQALILDTPVSALAQAFSVELWVQPNGAIQSSSQGSVGPLTGNQLFLPPDAETSSSLAISIGTNGIGAYSCSAMMCTTILAWSGTLPATSWSAIALVINQNQPRLYVCSLSLLRYLDHFSGERSSCAGRDNEWAFCQSGRESSWLES
jgi:hypothetical protein